MRKCGWTLISLLAVPLAACSGADTAGEGRDVQGDGSRTGGPGDQLGNPAGGDSNFSNPNAGGAPTPGPVVNPPTTSTSIDASFIWIANSEEGTVSKLDTRTTPIVELGRYRTSPGGGGLPSRTSVAADGDVAVANRGLTAGGIPAEMGGVMKIYASMEKCQDSNGNGVIDTSAGASDVRAFGEDECVAWYTPIPEASNRPVAWAPPPAPDAPSKVWTAGATACKSDGCRITVYRLDGTTGAIEDTVPIDLPMGPDFISGSIGGGIGGGFMIPGLPALNIGGGFIDNYGPYGAASDSGGNVWVFNANTTHLVRVDATTLEVFHWAVPEANGYGITIDTKGRVFICGNAGLTRFDPQAGTFTTDPAGGKLAYNGCMTDGAGGLTPGAVDTIWVGGGADSGEAGMHAFNADTLQHIASHPVGAIKGVSVDIDGFVWGVTSGGATDTAYRLDAATGAVDEYSGLVGAYSYSDMTGFGLASAGYQAPKPPE